MAVRTYGLSGSGMDVDLMVKNMMQAQRVRYDSMVQKKTQVEWKKTDLTTMYKAIKDFRDTTVFNYKLSSTLSPKQVNVSDSSKVKVTAGADAANLDHTLEISQLAKSAQMTSSGGITPAGATWNNLTTQLYGGTAPSPDKFNITISDGTSTRDVEVDTNKTIYDLVQDINKAGTKVRASYDATLDRFSLYTIDSGADTKIDLTGSTVEGLDFLEHKLKLDPATVQPGQNAKFELDGIALEQKTNNFTISGVSYELKAKTTDKIDIFIQPDNDKAVEAVKSFIESYNSMLSKINDELAEKRYKDFLPLTSDQRKAMSESDIKEWELKAKSGMLRNDPLLRDLAYKMRDAVATPVVGVPNPLPGMAGSYASMASIGITTGTYLENGKLYLDEAELKKALSADPEIVNKLFASQGASSSSQGVATRLYDSIKGTMEKIEVEAGFSGTADSTSTLGKILQDYDKNLDAYNKKLIALEDRYYRQFNAMEVALNKLTQQSSWLAQQFGS